MKRQDAAKEVVELKARLRKLEDAAREAERELAERKARRTTLVAEDEPVPDSLTAEIVAGGVALESTREAIEVVRGKVADAEKRAEVERQENVRRELVAAERSAEAALLSIDPAIRALVPVVAAAREAAARVGELMRQAGQPVSHRDVVSAFVIARLLADDILDAREFHGVRSHLLSGDPRIAAARSERLDAALADMQREAEAHATSREHLEYQLRVARAELKEVDRRCASTASALRERGPAQQKVRDLEAKLEAAA
jgi:hypothetical protein